MRIGVISDSHGKVHKNIFKLLNNVDLIIHGGDFGSVKVVTELETIAPVKGVFGNTDDMAIRNLFPFILKTCLSSVRYLIVHDIGKPERLHKEVALQVKEYNPHVVIFGHSHVPYNHKIGNTLFFNPGSASSGRQGYSESVGIITVSSDNISAKHIQLY